MCTGDLCVCVGGKKGPQGADVGEKWHFEGLKKGGGNCTAHNTNTRRGNKKRTSERLWHK